MQVLLLLLLLLSSRQGRLLSFVWTNHVTSYWSSAVACCAVAFSSIQFWPFFRSDKNPSRTHRLHVFSRIYVIFIGSIVGKWSILFIPGISYFFSSCHTRVFCFVCLFVTLTLVHADLIRILGDFYSSSSPDKIRFLSLLPIPSASLLKSRFPSGGGRTFVFRMIIKMELNRGDDDKSASILLLSVAWLLRTWFTLFFKRRSSNVNIESK